MIKEICDVIDTSDKVFILVMVGIILFLVGVTLVVKKNKRKGGEGK